MISPSIIERFNLFTGHPMMEFVQDKFRHFTAEDVDWDEGRRLSVDCKVKCCYDNAYKTMTMHHDYYEGYVIVAAYVNVITEHAWLVRNDKVIDPTLAIREKYDAEYLGVKMDKMDVLNYGTETGDAGPYMRREREKWQLNNPEKGKTYWRKWQKNSPEKIKAHIKKYHQENRANGRSSS